jgi:sulfoxide reductase heme-binding subunit YedZ
VLHLTLLAASDPTAWLVARASGLCAVLLLSGAMVAGLLLSGKPLGTRLRPPLVLELHRTLSLAALVATAAHASALVLDTTMPVSLPALVVPGLVDYRAPWVAAGVVAGELALVVHLSFRWKARIGARAWRRLHTAVFLGWALAMAHGAAAGTDSGRLGVQLAYAVQLAVVLGLTSWRVTTRRRQRRRTVARDGAPPRPERPPRREAPAPSDAPATSVASSSGTADAAA